MEKTTLVAVSDVEHLGYEFIGTEYLPEGEDEWYLRNRQVDAARQHWRHLAPGERVLLEKQANVCANWDDVLVTDPFDPSLISNTHFHGLVRIGKMERKALEFHDFTLPVGIVNCGIYSCDIGDDCAIFECPYISHYIVGDRSIIYRVGEMQTTDHAKFGNGIVKEGEAEEVRITIDIINEAGGRAIRPFSSMLCSDAWLWGTYRDDELLMNAFCAMTDKECDSHRGWYGTVGSQSVVKSCDTIKDVLFGPGSYVKGANKLKNLTLRSTLESPVQIGEGVELVNGIVGAGSRIFYGCKAVRFILGDNCNLKYGARLIHSILGDNSTVSCCEMLSNLIFPGHEQHHNNSFLIASLIMGQSNMAAGANIGSNHNSRGADGEMIAGRGFWPALSSTLKYDCRFASYVLITKGNYPYELDIRLPFSLVSAENLHDRRVVMPAYWWMYNLYALERNSWKYRKRDRRKVIRQHIETDYLAPDTAVEILEGLRLLCIWTAESWNRKNGDILQYDEEALEHQGRTLLEPSATNLASLNVTTMRMENGKNPVRILKPVRSYRAYVQMLFYYGMKELVHWCSGNDMSVSAFQATCDRKVHRFLNLGGQMVPAYKVEALKVDIKAGRVSRWDDVHAIYGRWYDEYSRDKAEQALAVLCRMLGKERLEASDWLPLSERLRTTRKYIEDQVFKTKQKDFHNTFRGITYRSAKERDAVLGRLDDNPFVKEAVKMSETIMGELQRTVF